MKHWKTTISGILLGAIIAVKPILETGQVDLKAIGLAALIGALGVLAKDTDSTGGISPA